LGDLDFDRQLDEYEKEKPVRNYPALTAAASKTTGMDDKKDTVDDVDDDKKLRCAHDIINKGIEKDKTTPVAHEDMVQEVPEKQCIDRSKPTIGEQKKRIKQEPKQESNPESKQKEQNRKSKETKSEVKEEEHTNANNNVEIVNAVDTSATSSTRGGNRESTKVA